MTSLHKHRLAQQWRRISLVSNVGGLSGCSSSEPTRMEREIRLGARHDTEAMLMLLASVASRRATMGNAGKEKALRQLTRLVEKVWLSPSRLLRLCRSGAAVGCGRYVSP